MEGVVAVVLGVVLCGIAIVLVVVAWGVAEVLTDVGMVECLFVVEVAGAKLELK